MDTQFNNSSFAYFNNLFFNLPFCFFDDFFNTGGMNTAICHQTLQGKARNLPAKRVK